MAAKEPPFLVSTWQENSDRSSRATLVSKAIVANCVAAVAPTAAVFNCAISTDESE